jgi:hypothetical protein
MGDFAMSEWDGLGALATTAGAIALRRRLELLYQRRQRCPEPLQLPQRSAAGGICFGKGSAAIKHMFF